VDPRGRLWQRWLPAGAAWLACLAFAGEARAQSTGTSCAAIAGGSAALESVDAEARLAFVRNVMRDQASRASTWRWAWTGIGFALVAGNYALIPLESTQDKKYEQVFVGTASFFIPLQLTVLPIHVRGYDEILERAVIDAETSQGHMMPCLVLDRAEDLLVLAAKDEARLTNPLAHVVGLVLDAGFAAVLYVLFRDVGGTILNGVGAAVITEAQILTTPTGAMKALERYRRGDLSGPTAPGVSLVARF
jgi:hypothetical protein